MKKIEQFRSIIMKNKLDFKQLQFSSTKKIIAYCIVIK